MKLKNMSASGGSASGGKKIISKTEKDTDKLAADFASKLKGGEIIALEGDLGAGKTRFVKGLAKVYNIKKHITSPTFVLMKVYDIKNKDDKIKKMVHIDAYRLEDPQELFYLGIEEYLNQPNTLVIIEWADKLKKYLNKYEKVTWIKINIKDKEREFVIK